MQPKVYYEVGLVDLLGRSWIEMPPGFPKAHSFSSTSSGGRGLKCNRTEIFSAAVWSTSSGGRGLKSFLRLFSASPHPVDLLGRSWIEISPFRTPFLSSPVDLLGRSWIEIHIVSQYVPSLESTSSGGRGLKYIVDLLCSTAAFVDLLGRSWIEMSSL